MRLAYLGTPAWAIPGLRALVEAGHDISVVVTGADRRRGRGAAVSPSPLKIEAERLGIPVAHELGAIERSGPLDLGVVVAYGKIIPARVLEAVAMVNVHFSLLPRWRGAAPVERAILAGDAVTGVSIMALEPTLDTGPLYATEPLVLEPDVRLSELRSRLADVGARLLASTLAAPLGVPVPQVGAASYAAKLDPSELRLTWARPAVELGRVVRLERAWTTWRRRRLRVLQAEVVAGLGATPGTLEGDVVSTGEGGLRLVRVQPESKDPMAVATWLHGARPVPGEGFFSS